MRFAIVIVGLLLHPLFGADRVEERGEDGEVVAALVTEDALSFDRRHSEYSLKMSSKLSSSL